MLQPYIVEKGCLYFVGRSVKSEKKVGALFARMNDIFSGIEEPIDEKFYGISVNFVNGTEDSIRTYWLCREVASLKDSDGKWRLLHSDTEALIIPPTRWLYIPVRYDDEAVMSLAPEEHRTDAGYLTVCVYAWARKWLAENGYAERDFPYELEIYGLHDGYGEVGADITLAIPIV